jgi:hypothetical protein
MYIERGHLLLQIFRLAGGEEICLSAKDNHPKINPGLESLTGSKKRFHRVVVAFQ